MVSHRPNHQAEQAIDDARRLFEHRGSAWYGGEAVSQLEHALQAAMFAEREGAPSPLIVAALLHDVGHLLHALPENAAEHGLDDRHEQLAVDWLNERFVPRVAEVVGMHVAAKRYLCAVDADYLDQLSPASQRSLRVQGGPMTDEQRRRFEQSPLLDDAVRLRRWDDAAKVVGLDTPPFEHFTPHARRAARGKP